MATDTWIIVNHNLWKKPAALVGLQNKQFKGYIPLLILGTLMEMEKYRRANGRFKMPIFGNLSRKQKSAAL